MHPLQRVARNPIAYRWLVLPARLIVELLESFLRFVTAGATRRSGLRWPALRADHHQRPQNGSCALDNRAVRTCRRRGGAGWLQLGPAAPPGVVCQPSSRTGHRPRPRRIFHRHAAVAHRSRTRQGVGHSVGALAELSNRSRSRRRTPIPTVSSHADHQRISESIEASWGFLRCGPSSCCQPLDMFSNSPCSCRLVLALPDATLCCHRSLSRKSSISSRTSA